MRLTFRDVAATLVVAAGLLLALSVVQGWGWPLLNGVRAGIIALGVAGMAACSASGWAQEETSFRDPFVIIASVVGVIALGVGIIGLFVGTMPYLVAMMGAMVLLWIITVLHRLLPAGTTRPATPALQ